MSHATRCEEEWRQVSWIIGCALATSYLDDEPPVSLMLLADPGAGKSSLMQRWYDEPSVVVASDVTSDALRHVVFPRMAVQSRRHILLPEFYKLFQRNQSTAANMVGVMSAAMSGEMHTVIQGEREMEALPPNFRVGVIGAMTNAVFRKWSGEFGNTGLMDRFLLVPVTISRDLAEYVARKVAFNDHSMLSPLALPSHITGRMRVRMPDHASEALYELVQQVKGHTHRYIGTMRAMVKGLALIHGESEVTARRLDGIAQMMQYIATKKPLEV